MFIGFVLYGCFLFPFHLCRNFINNVRYDRQYREIYTQGKRTFHSPRRTFSVTMPKEVFTLKPRNYGRNH